jgi:hypothetical protein
MVAVVSAAVSAVGGNAPMHGVLLIVGVLEGAILGFAQWLVLRRYIDNADWWILATSAGALIAWVMGLTVSVVMALAYVSTGDGVKTALMLRGVGLLGAGVGVVMGFSQWLVLKVHIRKAAWWIFANALAWSLGLTVAFIGAGMISYPSLSLEAAIAGVATGVVMGAIIGGITGIALVWLLLGKNRIRKVKVKR